MGCLGCKFSIPLSVQKAMNKEAEKKKNQKTTRIHIDFAVITARPADAATSAMQRTLSREGNRKRCDC
jgi:hypothetical protein